MIEMCIFFGKMCFFEGREGAELDLKRTVCRILWNCREKQVETNSSKSPSLTNFSWSHCKRVAITAYLAVSIFKVETIQVLYYSNIKSVVHMLIFCSSSMASASYRRLDLLLGYGFFSCCVILSVSLNIDRLELNYTFYVLLAKAQL